MRLERLLGEEANRKPFDLAAVLSERVPDAELRDRLKKLHAERASRFTIREGGAELARWSWGPGLRGRAGTSALRLRRYAATFRANGLSTRARPWTRGSRR